MSNSRNLSRTIRLDGTTTLYQGADAKLATTSTGVTITGDTSATNSTLTGYLRGPASFVIDPAAHGDDTGTVVIAGNLQVDGLTTTINSTTLTVDDLNIVLASGAPNAAAADGAGITIDGAAATLLYDADDDGMVFNKNVGIGTQSGMGPDTPITIVNYGTTTTIIPQIKLAVNSSVNDSTAGSSIDFVASGDMTAVGSRIIGTRAAAGANMDLRFHTGRDAFRMIIDETGQVGIGTDDPGFKLDVVTASGDGIRATSASQTIIRLDTTNTNAAARNWQMAVSSVAHGDFNLTTSTTLGGDPANATSRLYINASGNVGIGTDDPGCALDITRTSGWAEVHLDGASGGDLILKDDGVNYGEIYAGSGHGMVLKSYASQHMSFLTNADATAKMTIQSGGNVGIGTNNPAAWLQVLKDNNNSGNQFSVADTEGVVGAIRTYSISDPSSLILNHYYAVEGGGANEYMRYADFVANVGNGAGTTMRFITKNAANTYSTGLKIDNNGKVYVNSGYNQGNFGMYIQGKGAGVADARALHVRGFGGQTTIGGTAPTLVLQNADGTTNNITKLSFETASNGEAVSINCINTSHGEFYGDMAFNTRGSMGYSEKLRIMANGNVGIGTTAPGEKLEVVGNTNVRGELSVTSGTFGSQLYTQANAASNPNGNEANATTGWAGGYGAASISSVGTENGVAPTNGSYQLKYTGTYNGERMDYGFSVVAGKRYEITLNADWYQGSLYTLVYVATSTSGDNIGSAISSIDALNGTSYAEKKLTFASTVSGTVYLSLRMASTSSPQNITYIDNISIREIVGKNIHAKDQFLSGALSVASTIVAPNQIGFKARGNTSQWVGLGNASAAAWNTIASGISAGNGDKVGVNLTTTSKSHFNCWNTGNDFSVDTGKFTTSVAGKYLVTGSIYGQFTASAGASDVCFLLPYINGQQINEMYAGAPTLPAGSTFTVNFSHTIHLEVGDYVTWALYGSNNQTQVYGDHISIGAELLH